MTESLSGETRQAAALSTSAAVPEIKPERIVVGDQRNKNLLSGFDMLEPILPGLKRFLFTLCKGNYEDIQDCLQETAIRVIRSADSFQGQAAFRSWVFSIARNLVIDLYRQRKRRRLFEFDSELSELPELAAAADFNPEQQALRNHEQALVVDALITLPEKQRTCLYLKEIDGLSLAEIASMLKLPEGTVKSRLFHARRLFARAYHKLVKVQSGGAHEKQ